MGDMPSSNAVWGSYLYDHGFRRQIIPNECPECYTIADFCLDHPFGLYVLATGTHVVTYRLRGGYAFSPLLFKKYRGDYMATPDEIIRNQNEYCNLNEWWNAGYSGQGVGVWNCEGFTDHGKISRKRIIQAAPNANVFSGHISQRKTVDVVHDAFVMLDDGSRTFKEVPLKDFLSENKIRVITASFQPSPFQFPGYRVMEFWKQIIDEYDLCVFVSSGNDHKKDKKIDNDGEYIWYVGAVNQSKTSDPVRAGYSNGGEGLDFVDFTGIWAGTSFSSPYLAGKCALIRQRFPEMNRLQVYEYMKQNSKDLGETGADKLYGNGLLIMPKIEKEDHSAMKSVITTTKVLVNGEEKTVKRVMVDDENFIRLRDMEDVLGIVDVEYDAEKNLPIVNSK